MIVVLIIMTIAIIVMAYYLSTAFYCIRTQNKTISNILDGNEMDAVKFRKLERKVMESHKFKPFPTPPNWYAVSVHTFKQIDTNFKELTCRIEVLEKQDKSTNK